MQRHPTKNNRLGARTMFTRRARLASLTVVVFLSSAWRPCRAGLSVPPHHYCGAVPARRSDRHDCPNCIRASEHGPGSARPCRERQRCRRNDRYRPRGACDPRWLYALCRLPGNACPERRRLFASVRPGEGFRTCCHAGKQSAIDRGKQSHAGGGSEGVHRVAQGQSRQGHAGIGRHRQSSPCQRRIFSARQRQRHSNSRSTAVPPRPCRTWWVDMST